jgi:hypothetical protein
MEEKWGYPNRMRRKMRNIIRERINKAGKTV